MGGAGAAVTGFGTERWRSRWSGGAAAGAVAWTWDEEEARF